MYYDIRNVGYEFMIAEKCMNDNDLRNALYHYKLAVSNYENADNEYLIDPNRPYIEVEDGVEREYPSVCEMVDKAEKSIRKLKRTLQANNI